MSSPLLQRPGAVEAEAPEDTYALVQNGAQAPTEEIVAGGLDAAKPFIKQLVEAQAQLAAEDVARRDGHAPAADVVPDGHARQGREHPPEVVLAGPCGPGQACRVHRLTVGHGALDQVEGGVEAVQHPCLLPHDGTIVQASPRP